MWCDIRAHISVLRPGLGTGKECTTQYVSELPSFPVCILRWFSKPGARHGGQTRNAPPSPCQSCPVPLSAISGGRWPRPFGPSCAPPQPSPSPLPAPTPKRKERNHPRAHTCRQPLPIAPVVAVGHGTGCLLRNNNETRTATSTCIEQQQ